MRNCEFKPYKQKGWGHGSSSTLLALHVWALCDPQYY
jgi:hypothetical protein